MSVILSFVLHYKHSPEVAPAYSILLDADPESDERVDNALYEELKRQVDQHDITWESTGDKYEFTRDEYEKMWQELSSLTESSGGEYIPIDDNGHYLYPLSVTFVLSKINRKTSEL